MGAMELEEKTVQIRDDFDPDKILESGQCFRPVSYTHLTLPTIA